MMDNGDFPPNTMLADSANMDLDYIDELLLEGCWLEMETTQGSEFLNRSPSTSSPLFDSSFIWPSFEASNGEPSVNPLQNNAQQERQRSSFPENLTTSEPQVQNPTKTSSPSHNLLDLSGCSDLSGRFWIGPKANSGPGSSVMDRLIRALGYIKDSTRNKDALIQLWVPVNSGGRRFLTTNDQPFFLDFNSPGLASYRDISVNYQFPTEENSKEIVGLPGRVFKGKVPEWSPDVRFFRNDEFARVAHAQQCGIRGTLALPVFEQGSQNCLGVIEVVMTTQKANCRPEFESVCKALEAVDLRSSEVSNGQNVKACNGSSQAALPEILEVLRSACGTHQLPLAQTWVPCIQQGKEGSRHSDENHTRCVSTVDSACYVTDLRMQDFQEACSEHHLLKGEGVAGQAFMTNQPCFSSDVTSFTKTEYPLSHHAKIFGLRAAVAIRLRSIYTGTADFVLEFFLPVDCTAFEEQRKMLASLSIIIQRVCRSLRIITDKELEEENKAIRESGNAVPLFQEKPSEASMKKSLDFKKSQQDPSLRAIVSFSGDHSSFGEGSFLNAEKAGERRYAKAEKTITLQTLRQYFSGSLKDAAKSLGVCPTTLKRICRQHGIKRWPSRKIKKVGHSLQRLQTVMDSVQGGSGAFQIESFYSNFPDLASPNMSRISPFSTSKPSDRSKLPNVQPESGTFSPQAAASKSPSSSCSHSSSSSQCCSSKTQPNASTLNTIGGEDQVAKETPGNGVLTRARSEVKLHVSSDEVQKTLPRSQSHKSLIEHRKSGKHPPVPRSGGKSQEQDALRIKVTYEEEKIRFRMQNKWAYKNLLQEIVRRFDIDDTNGFHLKYLDDEFDWVSLTCDADLEECIDLCRLTQTHTIKLSLFQNPQQHSGSSFGSSSPS
ncbi:plant regulator RWP-RK family protein [Actinidia rufa]|uniref:Plant regulator RWP-RK family protein n=1 Tax=Actinidia rufa TaxID=165716 RepID=A0A7J0EJA4_9ERIC|nr:plant regulator RWP-RK family protein [Actinidia rufa]